MTKTVSAYEARTKLGELLNLVYYKGIDVVIERKGKAMVKLTKVEAAPKMKKNSKKNIDNFMRFAGIWKGEDTERIKKELREERKRSARPIPGFS